MEEAGYGKKARKRARSFWSDFKSFISKGNIIDLAIAVVIGGAFGKIVTSFVNDIITPPLALLFKSGSFEELRWVLREAVTVDGVETAAEVAIRYGLFIQNILNFLIIAFFIFLAYRMIKRAHGKVNKAIQEGKAKTAGNASAQEDGEASAAEATAPKVIASEAVAEPVPESTVALLTEIRDLLKENKENTL